MPPIPDQLLRRLRDPGLAGQILRFTIVGGLGFVLDAGILQTLVHFQLHPAIARVASLAAAVTFTWWANRTLTFEPGRAPSWPEFRAYVLTSLVGMAINYGVYSLAVMLGAPLIAGVAIGTVAGSVFNFIRYRVLLTGDPGS
jgi:putative flippase GtrA